MISMIGIALIVTGAITTYALCKAAAIESRLEEQDEVSKRVKEMNKNEHKIVEGNWTM